LTAIGKGGKLGEIRNHKEREMGTAELRSPTVARLGPAAVRTRIERLSRREPWRTLRAAIAGFSRHNGALWASALTYTSSLALVPMLALAFSVLAGLGGASRVQPLVERYLAMNSPEVADEIMKFVSNVSARSLGEIGGATLLVTTVLTLGAIENALNTIFGVARGRPWLRKFSDYLSVTFTVPLLVAAAAPMRSHLLRALPHLPGAAWAASTMSIWVAFTFLYLFFPNTRVRPGCAAIGGLAAAVALQLGQWGYVKFQVGAANYHAIYGALAAAPILLTWLYVAWIIVLFGAELTAAAQTPDALVAIDEGAPGFTRAAALAILIRAARRMGGSAAACRSTLAEIAADLGVGEQALRPLVERLKRGGILVEAAGANDGNPPEILLARNSSAITVAQALAPLNPPPADDERLAAALAGIEAAERSFTGRITLEELANGSCDPAPKSSAGAGDRSP
jgi:membrane protein